MTDAGREIRNASLDPGVVEAALGVPPPASDPAAQAAPGRDAAAGNDSAAAAAPRQQPRPDTPPRAQRRRRRALNAAYRIPLVGPLLAILAGIARLPAHIAHLRALAAHNAALTEQLAALQTANERTQHNAAALASRLAEAEAEYRRLEKTLSTLDARLDAADAEIDRLIYRADDHGLVLNAWLPRWQRWAAEAPQPGGAPDSGSAAVNLVERRIEALRAAFEERLERKRLDEAAPAAGSRTAVPEGTLQRLYDGLEEAVRGDPADVKRRLEAHLPLVARARAASGQSAVLDLGCGRGDWLALLAEHGVTARGVDTSEPALDRARALGLSVTQADALAELVQAPTDSHALITAIHVAEHLPFDALVALLQEAYRVLAPGGALLIETPNPANLVVGAHTFWIDPTHRAPLPPELLGYLCRACGYTALETRFLTPDERFDPDQESDSLRALVHQRLLGPYDYAISGWKPPGIAGGP